MERQQAREKAWFKKAEELGEMMDSEYVQARRKFEVEFNAIWDAGHAAGQQWVAIESVDDLPTEVGEYVWKRRDPIPGDFQHQHCFWSGALQRADDYVERFEAWMPIPEYQRPSAVEGDKK